MPIRVAIRCATLLDAPHIIAGINDVCAEQCYFHTDTFIINPHWESVLYHPESAPNHLLMISEQKGKFVGAINLFSGIRGSKDQHVAEMGIFVLRPYRDQGIGSILLQQALDWAIARGLEKIVLTTFSTNNRAIHLFKKFGFITEGVRRRQYKIFDQYMDELFMSNFLNGERKEDCDETIISV